MTEEDDFLKKLEELSAASDSSSKVDSIVDDKINYERRLRMMTGLYLIKNGLVKGLARAQGSLGKPLVRSHLSQLPPHKLTQEVEYGEWRLSLPFNVGCSKDLDEVDNQYDRTLTYEEFTSRFEILVTAVGEGRLDDKLDQQPELLIHGVMGLSGELLSRLSIDPKKGETYAMLEREMSLGEEDAEGKSVQINLAEQLKQAFELSRRYAKPSTSEIAVDTPKPLPSDTAEGFISTPKEIKKMRRIGKIRKIAKPSASEIATDIPVQGYIGIVGYTMNDAIASNMGLEKETRGVLVIGVIENSIAEKAGLRAGTTPSKFRGVIDMLGGDIIIGINDITINKMEEFLEYLSRYHKQGSQIKFTVLRDGKIIEITLVY